MTKATTAKEKLLEILNSQTQAAIREGWESVGTIEQGKTWGDADDRVKIVDSNIAFYFDENGNLLRIVNFQW